MFTILITLGFFIIGQIAALTLFHLNNKNNLFTSWKDPVVLLMSFLLNWIFFSFELGIFLSEREERIKKQ